MSVLGIIIVVGFIAIIFFITWYRFMAYKDGSNGIVRSILKWFRDILDIF